MFFDSWLGLIRTVIVGVCAYAALILLLRVSGKRTLSKMNSFDFVVTVALGSTLATVLLSKEVALVEGVAAFALLIALQFIITWASVRSQTISGLVKSEPSLLWHRGEFLRGAMRGARVTEGELLAAMRAQGQATLESVEAVVLETDGSFSIVARREQPGSSTLAGLVGRQEEIGHQ
ncbi:MAG: YetF domain-containing protein [Pyrinomonadaceae bacterium]